MQSNSKEFRRFSVDSDTITLIRYEIRLHDVTAFIAVDLS